MFEISADRKLKLLNRARFLCESCGVYSPFLTIHHKIPKREIENIPKEELASDDNLRILCEKCHRSLHYKDTMLEEEEATALLKLLKRHDIPVGIDKESLVKKILRIRGMNRDRKKRTEMVDDFENSGV